jgi:phosphate transport system substrate-binding protein
MLKNQDAPVLALAALLIATAPAASAGFTLPETVPKGTTIKIDGANSLSHLNQALKTGFQTQFPGTAIDTTENTTGAALQAVREGRADVATIGRPLTASERAEGLIALAIAQPKIAIVTGPGNPFSGSLTNAQLAKIFRGEITNWSQVGGPPGQIEFIDQTEESDTRTALGSYPVFQGAAFGNSPHTVKLTDNQPATLLGKLSDRSIGYILVNQLANRRDVKMIPLHQVMPQDSRYSFSQPLSYVYRGPHPNPAVRAFLGYVNAPATRSTITRAVSQDIATLESASSQIAPNREVAAGNVKASEPLTPINGHQAPLKNRLDSTPAIAPAQKPGFPWLLWFLPLLGLPLLGWLWLGRLGRDDRPAKAEALRSDGAAAMPEPVEESSPSTSCTIALGPAPSMASGTIALGPVPSMAMTPLLSHPPIHYAGQASPDQQSGDNPVDSFDSTAPETTPNGCRLVIMPKVPQRAVMGLPPTDGPRAYVYWDLPVEARRMAQAQGGQHLVLRVYDATNIDLDHQAAHSFRQYPIADDDRDRVLSLPQGDRDYVAEIGYLTVEGRMLPLVRSTYAHVPMRDSVSF